MENLERIGLRRIGYDTVVIERRTGVSNRWLRIPVKSATVNVRKSACYSTRQTTTNSEFIQSSAKSKVKKSPGCVASPDHALPDVDQHQPARCWLSINTSATASSAGEHSRGSWMTGNYRSTTTLENQIRPIAIGRGNWLFAGSLRAGQRAAAVMSLNQSAKLNGHDPYAYLKDVLTRLPTHKNNKIAELLPHRWQPSQA